MNYFIELTGQSIQHLLRDDYTNIPAGAVAISEPEGALLAGLSNFSDAKYINGTVIIDNLGIDRRAKIAEIDAAYNAAIAVIAATYPETERNSWAKQEQEARAWTANNAAATPLLSSIATARGTTLADICARVIANADAYAVYAGATIGKRQAKMIAIAAATTIADLEAITW